MWSAEAIAKKDIPLLNPEVKDTDSLSKYMCMIKSPAEISKGAKITITRGRDTKYILWCSVGIFTLPEEYVDESTIKIISEG